MIGDWERFWAGGSGLTILKLSAAEEIVGMHGFVAFEESRQTSLLLQSLFLRMLGEMLLPNCELLAPRLLALTAL